MINPHLVLDLRRAERIFMKRGQPNLAKSARVLRGALADSMNPDEGNCQNVINLANGGSIHA